MCVCWCACMFVCLSVPLDAERCWKFEFYLKMAKDGGNLEHHIRKQRRRRRKIPKIPSKISRRTNITPFRERASGWGGSWKGVQWFFSHLYAWAAEKMNGKYQKYLHRNELKMSSRSIGVIKNKIAAFLPPQTENNVSAPTMAHLFIQIQGSKKINSLAI